MSIVLDAMQLRALAEWASGYRGEVVDFYEGPDGQIGLWSRDQGDCPYPVVLTCDTPFVVQDRPAVTVARLGTAEQAVDLLNLPYNGGTLAADAAFWSESAVEKFLFPYYASKGSWEADLYAEALRTVFYGPRPIWSYEEVLRHPEDFMDPGAAEVQDQNEDAEEPFGLVHIPKSDYIEEGPEQDGARRLPALHTGGELGVLLRHRRTGKVRVRLLGEMVRERRRAPAPAQAC